MELPEGRKALPSHCIYMIKCDGAGNVQRFKASLVCKGNHQIEGIHYQATNAPTARFGTVLLAFGITAKYDLEILQIDVCTAFLGVDMEEANYVHMPQGYFCLLQTRGPYHDPSFTNTLQKMVLRLRKSFYGLKQSSHISYGRVKDIVITIGFVASHGDGGLFFLNDKDQGIVVTAVVVSVEDFLIIADHGSIGRIKDQINRQFRMHDLRSFSLYLGMNVKHNWEHYTKDIHWHSNIPTILAKFTVDESRPVGTPMAMQLHKRKPEDEACNSIIFQSMIGSLMYAITATQPDITCAIRVPCR